MHVLRSRRQTEWLEEVRDLLDDPKASSFDQLKDALDAGTELNPHPSVERALGEISGLLTQANAWEERAKTALAARPRLVLSEMEKLAKEGEAVSSGLPTLTTVKEAVRK